MLVEARHEAMATVGTVYGVLLNDPATLARCDAAFTAPPYVAPPSAPVLCVKPRNTFAPADAVVRVPADPGVVRIGATIGAVIGAAATRVRATDALSFVGGWRIVSDVSLPADDEALAFYRPRIRQRCRDGFCPMSDTVASASFDIAAAELVVTIAGAVVQRRAFAHLVRDLPTLLADVTAFMTLDVGDVLLIGLADDAPLASPGDRVRIDVAGLGSLSHAVALEPTP